METQYAMVWHVQRSDDPIDFQQKRWQHCNGHKRLQKKENETWIDCVSDTENLRRRGSSVCQAAECVKRRKQRRKLVNECVPSSAKYGPRSTSYGKQETVSTMRCQFSLRVAFLSRVSMLMRDKWLIAWFVIEIASAHSVGLYSYWTVQISITLNDLERPKCSISSLFYIS